MPVPPNGFLMRVLAGTYNHVVERAIWTGTPTRAPSNGVHARPRAQLLECSLPDRLVPRRSYFERCASSRGLHRGGSGQKCLGALTAERSSTPATDVDVDRVEVTVGDRDVRQR